MNQLMHRNADELAALRAVSGSIRAQTPASDGDGCVLDTIDRVISHLQDAKKALNLSKPLFPKADGHIEDAWHELRKVDTTQWTAEA